VRVFVCVCVCVCMCELETSKRGPIWAVAPQRREKGLYEKESLLGIKWILKPED